MKAYCTELTITKQTRNGIPLESPYLKMRFDITGVMDSDEIMEMQKRLSAEFNQRNSFDLDQITLIPTK